jgi:NitT/TauT family transport system substrate-binding protein
VRRRLQFVAATMLAACVAVIAAGCGSDDDSGSSGSTSAEGGGNEPVSLVSNLWIGIAPFVLAHDQGFDAENGVELDIKFVEELKDVTSSLGSGRADAAYSVGPGQATTLVQAGIPIKFLMVGDISTGGDQILGGEGVTSMADVRGKTVGVETASTGYPMLVYALEQNGMTLDDIQATEMTASQAGVALQSGRVEAAYTYQPYVNQALDQGFTSIYKAGDKPGIISDLLVGTDTFVSDHPDQVVGLLKSWQAGLDYLKNNPDESYGIVSAAMDIPRGEVAELLNPENLVFNDLAQAAEAMKTTFPELLPTFVQIVNDAENAPSELSEDDAQAAIDTGPLDEAAGE